MSGVHIISISPLLSPFLPSLLSLSLSLRPGRRGREQTAGRRRCDGGLRPAAAASPSSSSPAPVPSSSKVITAASGTIRRMLEEGRGSGGGGEDDVVVNLPEVVKGAALARVMEYCDHHHGGGADPGSARRPTRGRLVLGFGGGDEGEELSAVSALEEERLRSGSGTAAAREPGRRRVRAVSSKSSPNTADDWSGCVRLVLRLTDFAGVGLHGGGDGGVGCLPA
uniref:OSJNBa0023J03.9 protein n=1 Tax=Oryza sativa subsp. japonica TaxID=39947 RepID=Q7XVN9_ORYSJ|nr:OSJNBa0023J03.9 [Oryza sativa Japonica Group]